jgi:hypothetical protein
MVSIISLVGVVFTIILGVAALVAPLYILVLRMRRQDGVDTEQLSQIASAQEELLNSMQEVERDVLELRNDVEQNMVRSEKNQRHIHQILVGDYNAEGDEIGNPHHRAEHCPLPEDCPFHAADG